MRVSRLFLLLVLSLSIGVLLLGAADRALGWYAPHLPLAAVLFPPGARTTVATPEFTYTAVANELGFRDRSFSLRRTEAYRIVVIGDSFTYGWGVALEESWVKLVETRLREDGHDVETLDLGKPGIGPADYATIAEEAIPLLRPDLVLVAVLQTDDLQQSLPNPVFSDVLRVGRERRWKETIRRGLTGFTPHLLAAARLRHAQPLPWPSAVEQVVAGLTAQERARFAALRPELRQQYLDGQLNPGLMVLSVKDPTYFSAASVLDTEFTRARIAAMARHLGRIRDAVEPFGGKLAVLSIPYRLYVSQAGLESTRRLGFEVDKHMVDSAVPDQAIEAAARLERLPLLSTTARFRERCRDGSCYFALDDHFNGHGHQVYAELVTPLVARTASLLVADIVPAAAEVRRGQP
jgi:hypothetical protein